MRQAEIGGWGASERAREGEKEEREKGERRRERGREQERGGTERERDSGGVREREGTKTRCSSTTHISYSSVETHERHC